MAEMDERGQVRLPRLEGTRNFRPWKRIMQAQLLSKGLWSNVTGRESSVDQKDWDERDSKARGHIFMALGDDAFAQVSEIDSAKELWSKLCELYGENGYAAQFMACKNLNDIECRAYETIDAYIGAFRRHTQEIKSAGIDLAEAYVTNLMLTRLDASWDTFVSVHVQSVPTAANCPDFDTVAIKLRNEERRRALDNSSDGVANVFRGRGRTTAKRDKSQIICYQCQERGHIRRDCPQAKNSAIGSACEDRHGHANTAFAGRVTNSPGKKDSRWILDSGSTWDATWDLSAFVSYTAYADGKQPRITLADHSSVSVHGIGTVRIPAIEGSRKYNLVLEEVRHVPSMGSNLMALSTLFKRGWSMSCHGDRVRIYKKGVYTLAEGVWDHAMGLYCLRVQPSDVKAQSLLTAGRQEASLEAWHRRLGHLGYDNVRRLEGMVSGMVVCDQAETPQGVCEACVKGGQHRNVSRVKMTPTAAPLDLVHVDLGGSWKMPRSVGGARYWLVLTDDFSRYRWVFTIHTKSEAHPRLQEFLIAMKTQRGKCPSRMRSDNGGEFDSERTRAMLRDFGVRWEPTAPYSPEQNGVAERSMRTLLTKARSQLFDSGLDERLWAEALHCAVYLTNRSPTKDRTQTPYELWEGRKPDVSHLRVFGSTAWVHIPTHRGKLGSRSRKGRLVGYEGSNQYRVWDAEAERLRIVRDVLVDEFSGSDTAEGNLQPVKQTLIDLEDSDEVIEVDQANSENREARQEVDDDDTIVVDVGPRQTDHPEETGREEPGAASGSDTQTALPSGGAAPFPEDGQAVRRSGRSRVRQNYAEMHRGHLGMAVSDGRNAEAVRVEEPTTYEAALESPDASGWKEAMQQEIAALEDNHTWDLVEPPEEANVLRGRWVYKRKPAANGKGQRYKARWVVKGYEQEYGVDYWDTFAAVVKPVTTRVLLALGASLDWEIEQMDVKTAFLHGKLAETVYVEQPTGYTRAGGVCQLQKALYGLKQAPRVWYRTLAEFLLELGFQKCVYDEALFVNETTGIRVAVYVDDLLILGPAVEAIRVLKDQLQHRFRMTDLGPVCDYLGMTIVRDRGSRTLSISQQEQIQKTLQTAHMDDCTPSKTPLAEGLRLEPSPAGWEATRNDKVAYAAALGKLNYVMVMTRPDIAFAVSKLGQFAANPSAPHWGALKRLYRYLKGTTDIGIQYQGDGRELTGYSDSDWAGDIASRKSTGGYVFTLLDGAVSWSSKRQGCVAKSSTEAEYMAVSRAGDEAIWLRGMFAELMGDQTKPIVLWSDNQGAIHLSHNPEYHARTKHIDVSYHVIRERVEQRLMELKYLPTGEMPADGLTKALGHVRFGEYVQRLGLKTVKEASSQGLRGCVRK